MNAVSRLVVGAFAGLAVGLVLAVNLVIFAGIGEGYETRIGDIFDENLGIGVLVIALWVVSPFVGAYIAWRPARSRRS